MTDYTIPRANIVETTLPDEPATDKAFRNLDDGHEYRVRIIPGESSASGAALYTRSYMITITRLEADKAVMRNHDGTVDIVASTNVSIDKETWLNGNTPADTFQRIIENQIHNASETSREKHSLDDFMSDWGVASHASASKDTGVSVKVAKTTK